MGARQGVGIKLSPQKSKDVWVEASFAVFHYHPIGGTKDYLCDSACILTFRGQLQ